ncbi:CdaR family protein [Clostridiaceae bacterium M8S5]|nr:CdaR family protein [Clostridiaceae bacterium M8S5]
MEKKKKNNIPIKILAAIFAIVLWFYVMNEVNPVIDKEITDVKVNYIGQDSLAQANIMLMEPKQASVTVKISGRRAQILNIGGKDLSAEVDLVGYKEGSHKIPVKILQKGNFDEIVDYYPKEILFQFDEIVEEQMPVTIRTKGRCKEGYITGKITAKPNDILLKGPSSFVHSVKNALTTVNISGTHKDIKVNVPITITDKNGKEVNGVTKNPSSIDVTIPVYKTKEVPIKLNTVGVVKEGYEITNITVEPGYVNIKGYEEDIDKVNSLLTEEISLNSITTSKTINDIKLILPQGISLVTSDTHIKAKIQIEAIGTKNFEYASSEIKIKNLGKDLNLNIITPEYVVITVKGPQSVLDYISRRYLTPYIDVSGYKDGQHKIDLKSDDLYKTKVISINPNKIEVKIVSTAEESSSDKKEDNEIKDVINNDKDMEINGNKQSL